MRAIARSLPRKQEPYRDRHPRYSQNLANREKNLLYEIRKYLRSYQLVGNEHGAWGRYLFVAKLYGFHIRIVGRSPG